MRTTFKAPACFCILLLTTSVAGAAEGISLADAIECRPRSGLPNALARLKGGQELTVAYIGGSITAQNGWRPKTTAWLKQQYPTAKVVEIDAAIGGTGSDLGVFRFRQDVLDHHPHLIFIEFAVNDGGAPPQQIYRCMEGMVRQAWKQDSKTDICFVYTLVDSFVPTIQSGKFPRAASAMERVAEHYQISSIHMGLEVARLAKEGKLILKVDPKTEQERTALKDKIVFSADGVHPHPETGHQLYLEAIARSFEKMKDNATPAAHKLPDPFVADNYENAKLVSLSKAKLSEGWEKLDPQKNPQARAFRKYLPEMYYAAEPGQSLSFSFKGRLVGFIDLLGPDCGQLQMTIDDAKLTTVARFDAYCTYHRIGSFIAGQDLSDSVHSIRVTVDDRELDKAAILARNGNKIENPKRFAGKGWYVGSIMLIGDLAD